MTPWLIAALLLALVLIEDCCRRSWRRSFRDRQRWIDEHYEGKGDSAYDLEMAWFTRRSHP